MNTSLKGSEFWCEVGRGKLGEGVQQSCLQVDSKPEAGSEGSQFEIVHLGCQTGKLMTGVLLKEEDSVWG